MHLVIICYFSHICVSNKIEGVRIPCCAHCIQMQTSNLCTYLGELPHFICITNLCSTDYLIYLGILIGLNIFEGIRMPYLCIVYSNANYNLCTNIGEFSSYYLEQSLKSYHNIFISFGILFLPIGSLDLLIAWFVSWCFFTLIHFAIFRSSI